MVVTRHARCGEAQPSGRIDEMLCGQGAITAQCVSLTFDQEQNAPEDEQAALLLSAT